MPHDRTVQHDDYMASIHATSGLLRFRTPSQGSVSMSKHPTGTPRRRPTLVRPDKQTTPCDHRTGLVCSHAYLCSRRRLHRRVLPARHPLEVLLLEQGLVHDRAEVRRGRLVTGLLHGLGNLGNAHRLALERVLERIQELNLILRARPVTGSEI